MPFAGKATYSAGSTLPEIAEDVSDLVSLISPHETALLDHLGDAPRPARSTVHEWLEDTLLPNTDVINDSTYTSPTTDTTVVMTNITRFRIGDVLRNAGELLLVTGINEGTSTLTIVRGYGGSTAAALANGATLNILSNASLEGDDASTARFTSRARRVNYTQIFASTVEVSGSELAVRTIGVADELDYQKQQRLRELLRDLENTVINGRAAATSPEGTATVRRTMRGILPAITTNRFTVGTGGFPADTALTEVQLNQALREIWRNSAGNVDAIVVGGQEKRAINNFLSTSSRRYAAESETFKQLVGVYESDFGVCRVVLSRWVPAGTVMLLDSSRISVMPLTGRSFFYKPLATTGDRDTGQVIGEYTLEFRNEAAHGVISGLTT
jgi:hypothetical protein